MSTLHVDNCDGERATEYRTIVKRLHRSATSRAADEERGRLSLRVRPDASREQPPAPL